MLMLHKPVLLQEVLEFLDIKPDDKVFDGTLGSAGHAQAIVGIVSCKNYVATDLDKEAIERAKSVLPEECHQNLFEDSFENIDKVLHEKSWTCVNKVLLDLGWSQDQFELSGRGFSFAKDEPLVMSFKANPSKNDITAYDMINFWHEDTLADIIEAFGEERFARRIARAIVERRRKSKIKTSKELAEIVREAIPARFKNKKIDPATKTFQALRIATNQELEVLQRALDKLHDALCKNGRIAVISFHSLEDRIVKMKFKEWAKKGSGKLINKKVITASKEELQKNKRARSAKLRVYEKI